MANPTKMMIPPIVGVPALEWWPSGPSSRMFCPNSLRRRKSMNLGLANRQISNEAVPAISTRPEIDPGSAAAGARITTPPRWLGRRARAPRRARP
jgi:hypothetical protein